MYRLWGTATEHRDQEKTGPKGSVFYQQGCLYYWSKGSQRLGRFPCRALAPRKNLAPAPPCCLQNEIGPIGDVQKLNLPQPPWGHCRFDFRQQRSQAFNRLGEHLLPVTLLASPSQLFTSRVRHPPCHHHHHLLPRAQHTTERVLDTRLAHPTEPPSYLVRLPRGTARPREASGLADSRGAMALPPQESCISSMCLP